MDAADLRIFEAVARLGGMNRAAAELHTVQSNVTARIRALEEQLQAPLFERHSRGVTLTAAGRRLLPYAQLVRRLLEDARRAVADDGAPRGSLGIGSLETTAAVRLAPILADYVTRYPEVDLVLRTGTTQTLIEAVLADRLEGAFVCGPVNHPELDAQTMFHEELAIVTAPAVHAVEEAFGLSGLKIVVLHAGCSYRQRLEAMLAARGVVGVRLLEFGTVDAILGCVAAGLGITLLPKSMVETARRSGRVAVHDTPGAEVETVFVRRRDAFVSSALSAFLASATPALVRADAAE